MQFNPFLKYSYKLNGERIVGISLGPNITEKAEESFDEGGFNLPINVRGIEYEMNGTLEIEIKDSRNNVRSFTYLIIFDEVHKTSVYGWFTHSLRVVEYTNKLNSYFVDTLITSYPNQHRNVDASRTIPINNYIRGESPNTFRVVMPKIDIKEVVLMNNNEFTIKGNVGLVDYIKIPSPVMLGELAQTSVFVMLDNDPSTIKNLSIGDATFENVSEGYHTIQYGLMNVPDLTAPTPTPENPYYPIANVTIYEFYITAYNNSQLTLYDVIQKLRNIKPFETKFYHLRTRLFNIDDTVVVNGYTLKEILQKTPAPQFFIQKATMFQVLSGIFKYINSIPRLLRNGNYIDNLSRDDFNNVVGTFSTSGMYDYTSSQDIQLYGTRGISPLERTLPNNLDKPNIETPANNFFKTIRATNVQLTMNNNEWYIPLEKNIYMLTKFEVKIPNSVVLTQTYVPSGDEETIYNFLNGITLDITSRVIDKRLWDLKDNQNLFPTIDYLKEFDEYVGARNNKSGNIYWEQGENGIRIANYMGELIKKELLINVIKEAIHDKFSYEEREKFYIDFKGGGSFPRMVQQLYIGNSGNIDVMDLKFNIEYVTLQDFNVSQEREDRSIINRFSEIALKQSDKQINVELASRKSYGELQRGALPNYSFSMVHNYLDEIIDLFTVDNEGYTIVERSMTFYNTYIDVVYVATKDHNRLQEFIGVNQEYRAWEIPTSNKIYDRKETYVDYVFIVPSNEDIKYTITKNLMTSKFYRQLVSNLQNDKTYSKITFGLVYTDGFGREYGNIEPNNNFKLLIVPTIVVGAKQSLVFSLGFNDNQLAGNSLEKEGDLTYNKAVRYTDFKGELNEFWMALFSNIEDLEDILDTETYNYDDYPLTPEIEKNSSVITSMLDNSVMNNGTIMTSTPSLVHGEYNPFIVDKDSHENITIQYNVSVMSFNYGQFVVGQRFTSFNPLVNNDLDDLYIYVYNNQNYTKYGIFNDQMIRNMGNATKVLLSPSNVAISDINYGQNRYGVRVEFIGTLKTLVENNSNWAIGDNEGNLYLACNENISSFDFLGTHQDIRVKEIGKNPIIYNTYIYMLDDIVSHVVEPVSYVETISLRTFDYVSEQYPYQKYLLEILLEDSVIGDLVDSNNISETIGVTLGYDYNSYVPLKLFIQETIDGVLVSVNTLNEVINTFVTIEGEAKRTATPTVGTPYCKIDGGVNSYRVIITNNENMSVTIRNGNVVLGTMTALETKEFIFDSGKPTPYNYSINITAQASGLQRSTNVNRSGTIILCTLDN